MQNNEISISQNVYIKHLETVNDVRFTIREIEIIACIFHMRGTSKIASFLSIAPRTVETHAANIMRKMSCNSREGIIDFLEKSGKSLFVRRCYQDLLIQTEFKKRLKEISHLIRNEVPVCYIIYEVKQRDRDKESLINEIQKYFKLCGIKIVLNKEYEEIKIIDEFQKITHIIYLVSEKLIEQFQADKSKRNLEISRLVQKAIQNSGFLTFLLLDERNLDIPEEFREIGCIDSWDQENHYFLVFEILRRTLPSINFDKIILEFKKYHELIDTNPNKVHLQIETKQTLPHLFVNFLRKRTGKLSISGVVCLSIFCALLLVLKENKPNRTDQINKVQETQPIRSDLPLPHENIFLKRPEILKQIDEKLKGQKEIQRIALVGVVGMGGVGKTTLARQFGHLHKSSVVWEINAETKNGLVCSFKDLAYSLVKTADQRNELSFIESIKNSEEKKKQIFSFVKKQLRKNPGWLLIYDNVETLSNIKDYFPQDPTTWGSGKVILTTKDSNIKNSGYIDPKNIIQIGELTKDEALNLFSKILYNCVFSNLKRDQKEKAINFLKYIPHFPLDVSVAAYYIKNTQITYEQYLERIKESSKDFYTSQETLLKEVSDYTKTRYGIITLSLKNIINAHPNFKDLLLFISLLDSQNIPKDLLNNYKSDLIVTNFILNLKKNSLITDELNSFFLSSTFSIHRSTQEICLEYITDILLIEYKNNLLHSICYFLESYISKAIEKEDIEMIKILYPHYKVFLTHENIMDPDTKINMNINLGGMYIFLDEEEKAKQILLDVFSKINKADEKNHIRIAQLLTYLGLTYKLLGGYNEAQNYLEKGLIIYEKYFLENHSAKASVLTYLGDIYVNLGNYEKAEDLLEMSLRLHHKFLPGNQRRIAWVLAYLGNVHTKLGNYEKARNLLEQSLLTYNKYFSKDYAHIAWVLAYLGNLYKEKGNYKKAKTLLQKSAEIYTQIYGKFNIERAWILQNLGETYILENNVRESEKFIKEAVDIIIKKNHYKAHVPLEKLAELCLEKYKQKINEKNVKEAELFKSESINYLKQALKIIKLNSPENFSHTKRIKSKLKSLSELPIKIRIDDSDK